MANYLYNGVELPDINAVWTDRETYPYAYLNDSRSQSENPGYRLYLMGTYATANSETDTLMNGDMNYVCNRPGNRDKPYAKYVLKDGVWTYYGGKDSGGLNVGVSAAPCFWSNQDILRTDGTLYLAGSAPVSLDGMTVIDWDGDPDGHASPDGTYFKVSDTVPTVSDVLGGCVLSNIPDHKIFHITEANCFASAEDGTLRLCMVDSTPLVLIVSDAGKAGFDTGVYFLSLASAGTDYHTTKLAYTPSSGDEAGGSVPEAPGAGTPFGSVYVGDGSSIAQPVTHICIGSADGFALTVRKAYIGDESGRAVCWWGSA